MIMKPELVARINELAAKNKREGLTPEEIAERSRLREEYLKEFRAGFKHNILDNLYIVDDEGNKVKVEKKK
jgi:uncharacterized protein YnzC (UPF0291/DUF896 family)